MSKQITLNHIGYYVEGTSTILLWGGGKGYITISPYKIMKTEFDRIDIIIPVNDNGYGCEKLLSAKLEIYELYEGNHTEHYDTLIITTEELDKYNYINSKYLEETFGVKYPSELGYNKE